MSDETKITKEDVLQIVDEATKQNATAFATMQIGHLLLTADLSFILLEKEVISKDDLLKATEWMSEKPEGVDDESYQITKSIYDNYRKMINGLNLQKAEK